MKDHDMIRKHRLIELLFHKSLIVLLLYAMKSSAIHSKSMMISFRARTIPNNPVSGTHSPYTTIVCTINCIAIQKKNMITHDTI